LLAQILEQIGQLVADLVAHRPRDADPARLGERFEARRDIDPVAKDVAVLGDDVAEVDADTKSDAPLVRYLQLAVDHPALDLSGAADGVDNTAKFRQQAVTSVFYRAPLVLTDLWLDQLREMRSQAVVGAFLVRPHQPARHIGGKDRGETADRGHCSPGAARLIQPTLHPNLPKSAMLYVGRDSRIRALWKSPAGRKVQCGEGPVWVESRPPSRDQAFDLYH
jgi:hypothetical protein